MSRLIEVLAKLDSAGGTLSSDGEQLRLKAPPGTLSDEDQQVLAKHKQDILAMLGAVTVTETPVNTGNREVSVTDTADEDLDEWLADNTVEPTSCDKCGGLEQWQDLRGGWHCSMCDPPTTAERIRDHAERIRRGGSPVGS